MRITARRALAACIATLTLTTGSALAVPTYVAAQEPEAPAAGFPLDYDVTARIFLAGINQTNTVRGGKLVGEADLATGTLIADLTLPRSETWLKLGRLPLALVGFKAAPTGQATGTIDLANGTVTTSATFYIKIPYLHPFGWRWWNLVGNNCQTSTPITIDASGPLDLGGPMTFRADFTVPRFKNCGFLTTPILNLLVPGPGNTFTATLTPAAG